jgi:hydrogenase large subunit
MPTITVMDPVTRIEGHLKVELTVDLVGGQQQVVDARCTGTQFRGFELLLEGRATTDAPVLTQRICGVCPVSHSLASTMALEHAGNQLPPANGRILRNLLLGANYLQSHILHFYLLALLDYVRGPQAAPWAPAWEVDLRPDPRFDEAINHFLLAVEARRRAHEMAAVIGGRMPLSHAPMPGGFSAVALRERIASFRNQLAYLTEFIRRVQIPDAEALAAVYDDYRSVGVGPRNLLAYGVFELDNGGTTLLARGRVRNGGTTVEPVALSSITERVTHSWYDASNDNLNPATGATTPTFPKSGAYSWLKSPRYSDQPYEVGALARMWVNGDYRRGISVMDRHLARAYEALKVANAMREWLQELDPAALVYQDYVTPTAGSGVGLTEAPRGALGHWVAVAGGALSHYQVVTPTCWNASPRDAAGVPGPMEQALIGTPIIDAAQPVEALRVIHSFDPCLSCAVHVMRPDGEPTVLHTGLAR